LNTLFVMNALANRRVRCRAHNALYAEEVFGRGHVEERIHLRRDKCSRNASERVGTSNASTCGSSMRRNPVERRSAPARRPAFETAARALCSLGFREAEVRKALVLLETKLDVQTVGIDTILREALLALT
jgi:RuvA, C-terminal domain